MCGVKNNNYHLNMEAHANSTPDYLIDGLDFKLKPGASYVTNRRGVTFWPTGASSYSTTSSKVIKIQLNGDAMLDPSTLRFQYELKNDDAAANHVLRTISGPWSFFRRLRVMCQGAVVEDISDYNRLHQMFDTLTSPNVRENNDIEGFETRFDKVNGAPDAANMTGLAPSSSKVVSFKLLSGLFSQPRYLPIRYCPITIELELVSNKLDPIVDPAGGSDFSAANTSSTWSIEAPQIKCDLCDLDNAVENKLVEKLLSGASLPINYSTYISQQQAVSGSDITVNVSRAATRLKSVFVSLYKADGNNATSMVHKEWSYFQHPMDASSTYSKEHELEYQLQIGSKLFPEYPVRSLAESFTQLRKCLGVHESPFHSLDVSAKQYRENKFVVGVDTEKVLEAGFTGINTRSGDLMTVKMKAQNQNTVQQIASSMFVVLHTDNILNIRDTNVEVFD